MPRLFFALTNVGRSFHVIRPALFMLGLICLASPALSESPAAQRAPGLPAGAEFQVFIENDWLARTDRYYTNGIKLGGGVPAGALGGALQGPASYLLRSLVPDAPADVHLGLFLGQNLYTPRQIAVDQPQPYDRPWAAWLYLGGVAQRLHGDRLDTVELDVGVVGPPAQGEGVQRAWHRLIGATQPQGWRHQIPSEAGFLLSYLTKRKVALGGSLAGGHLEFIPHAGVTVGTVMALARVGGLVRWGRNMSGFGPDTVEPGGAMLQNMDAVSSSSRGKREWYVFAGMDQRLVARNIFLDGTLFHGGPSVSRRPHVYDVKTGLSLRIDWLRISATRTFRSEEFHTARGGGGRQIFDSINVGMEF